MLSEIQSYLTCNDLISLFSRKSDRFGYLFWLKSDFKGYLLIGFNFQVFPPFFSLISSSFYCIFNYLLLSLLMKFNYTFYLLIILSLCEYNIGTWKGGTSLLILLFKSAMFLFFCLYALSQMNGDRIKSTTTNFFCVISSCLFCGFSFKIFDVISFNIILFSTKTFQKDRKIMTYVNQKDFFFKYIRNTTKFNEHYPFRNVECFTGFHDGQFLKILRTKFLVGLQCVFVALPIKSFLYVFAHWIWTDFVSCFDR